MGDLDRHHLLEAGLPPLPPFKTVDTLKVLRREFKSGAPFKSLDAFCQIVGIPSKTDRYDPDKDAKPYMQNLEVELLPTDKMLLDALMRQVSELVLARNQINRLVEGNPDPELVRSAQRLSAYHTLGSASSSARASMKARRASSPRQPAF